MVPAHLSLNGGARAASTEATCHHDVQAHFCVSVRALVDGGSSATAGAEAAVPAILALLPSDSPAVTLEATAALLALCKVGRHYVEAVIHRGGIERLKALALSDESLILTYVVGVLSHVAGIAPAAIVDAEVLSVLIRLMGEGSRSDTAYWAVATLQHVVETSDEALSACCDTRGAMESIFGLVCCGEAHAEPAGRVLRAILASNGSLAGDGRERRTRLVADAVKMHSGQPPLAQPELMQLLQGVAEEQIAAAVQSQQRAMLEDSIAFARWLKLPSALYGAARKEFAAIEREKENLRRRHERREALGLANGAAQKAAIRGGVAGSNKGTRRLLGVGGGAGSSRRGVARKAAAARHAPHPRRALDLVTPRNCRLGPPARLGAPAADAGSPWAAWLRKLSGQRVVGHDAPPQGTAIRTEHSISTAGTKAADIGLSDQTTSSVSMIDRMRHSLTSLQTSLSPSRQIRQIQQRLEATLSPKTSSPKSGPQKHPKQRTLRAQDAPSPRALHSQLDDAMHDPATDTAHGGKQYQGLGTRAPPGFVKV